MKICGLDSDPQDRDMAGSCGHSNEPSGSKKGEEFLD
jgi:hypothetical protein